MSLTGDEKYRIHSDLSEIDPELIEVFLKKEDKYFYWHLGFNPISFIRAIFVTYIMNGKRQGASTLTMQTVRLLNPESTKSFYGKILQTLQSLKIEILYTKKEILTAYLNWTPYGSNIEGIGAACHFYFNSSCKKLTPYQIDYLVQIPQSPQRFNSVASSKKASITNHAPHFIDYLRSTGIERKKIVTTLDYKMNESVKILSEKYFQTIKKSGIKNYSIMIADSKNNDVIVYIGSADYKNVDIKGQIDANRSLKSPGSTLKPFIYALALQQGLIHEKSLLKDTRMTFAGINPENFDEQFLGPISADQALIQSRNLPAVDLSMKLQNPSLYDFLNRKSKHKFKNENYYGLSLALGGVEFSMHDLIKLYSALGKHGKYSELNFQMNSKFKKVEKILSPESSYIALQMLKKNSRTESSTLQDLTDSAIPVAWKTGTSKSYKDAWTVGLIGNYTVGVWFGDNDRQMNPALVGRNIAAPLFFKIYDLIRNSKRLSHAQAEPFWNTRLGLNIKSVDICSVSKKVKTENCTHHTESTLMIPGITNIETCQIHRKIFINPVTKKISCTDNEKNNSVTKIVEIWPDDLLDVYRSAGLRKKLLSMNTYSCSQADNPMQNIVIASPQNNIDYLMYGKKDKNNKIVYTAKISLQANSTSDSEYLDWYINKGYAGRFNKKDPLFYEATQPGKYHISVIDNLGRFRDSFFSVKIKAQQQ